MLTRSCVLMLTALSAGWLSNADADSWAPAMPYSVLSADSAYRVAIRPSVRTYTTIDSCVATVFRRMTSGDNVAIDSFRLRNDVAPVATLISNDGIIVTFDEWAALGYGDNVIAIYDRTGKIIRSFSLEGILPSEKLSNLRYSVSSRWWRKNQWIENEGHKVVIRLNSDISVGEQIEINLQSGKVLAPAWAMHISSPYQWQDTLWTRRFPYSAFDGAVMAMLSDSTFVICGSDPTESYPNRRLQLLRMDQYGHTLWSHVSEDGFYRPRAITETRDGGFALVAESYKEQGEPRGSTIESAYILRGGGDSPIAWTQSWRGYGDCEPTDIKETSDGGFLIVGDDLGLPDSARTPGQARHCQLFMLRVDSEGQTIWERHFSQSALHLPIKIAIVEGGDFLLLGGVERSLMRLSAEGDSVWGMGLPFDKGTILIDADGNALLHGSAPQWSSSRKGTHLVTVTTSGSILKDVIISTATQPSFIVNAMTCTKSGGYLVGGTLGSGMLIADLDGSGNLGWKCTLGGGWGATANALQELADGSIFAVGTMHYDLFVVRVKRS